MNRAEAYHKNLEWFASRVCESAADAPGKHAWDVIGGELVVASLEAGDVRIQTFNAAALVIFFHELDHLGDREACFDQLFYEEDFFGSYAR